MHEFISVFSNKLLNSQFDLSLQFRRRATNETLDYIQQNMPNAIMFLSSEKLFEHLIPKIEKNGSILEFGVFKGKSIKNISKFVEKERSQIIHGFDSFEGLPEDWLGFNDVKGRFDLHGVMPDVPENVKLHKGWFDSSLPEFLTTNDQSVSFLHIDVDLYSSTKTVLDLLRERITTNTIIVFDEYFNYPNWQHGEFKAFQEFVKANDIHYEYLAFTSRLKAESVAIRITQKG